MIKKVNSFLFFVVVTSFTAMALFALYDIITWDERFFDYPFISAIIGIFSIILILLIEIKQREHEK